MHKQIIYNELTFKAVRSSGAGGQHVNKVSSKVELYFNILNSDGLSDDEKNVIFKKLNNRINKAGYLILSCQENRSQHRNKELVVKQFYQLLTKSFIVNTIRKQTKPSKASKLKRLLSKKRLSEKKENRKKIWF